MSEASDYVTAAEAAGLLGVKPHTLYTYVSRGFIRSVAQPDRKARLYYREDVERALARSEARQGQGPAAEGAMRWGPPVVDTTITEITPQGPRYRGWLATDLARGQSFEACADLLWTGVLNEDTRHWTAAVPPDAFDALMRSVATLAPERQIRRVLAAAAESLALAHGGNPEVRLPGPIAAARELIQALGGAMALLRPGASHVRIADGESVAGLIARAAGIAPDDDAGRAIDAALIVSADHEFAPSTFAARIAASTGSDIHACVVSALCAFEGTLTGLGCDKAEDLLSTSGSVAELRRRFTALQRQGQKFPGFNHPFYPRGDPRALTLIEIAKALPAPGPLAESVFAFIDEAGASFQAYPSLPVGLVTLAAALRLPPRTAGAIMALGRVAGWVAHVQEQRLAGFLLRPRARYVGAAA
jgi:citrate synthase